MRRVKSFYLYRNPTPSTCEVLTDYGWYPIEDTLDDMLVIYDWFAKAKKQAEEERAMCEAIEGYKKRRDGMIIFRKFFKHQDEEGVE